MSQSISDLPPVRSLLLLAVVLAALFSPSSIGAQGQKGFLLTTDGLFEIALGPATLDEIAVFEDGGYSGLTLDSEGGLWTIDLDTTSLVQLSPENGDILNAVALVGVEDLESPDLTFDSCGDLWFTTSRLNDADLYRLDIETGNAEFVGSTGIDITSLTSVDNRLVALTFNEQIRESAFVDLSKLDAQPFRVQFLEQEASRAWVDFSLEGALWGVSPSRGVGPTLPGETWTANPGGGPRSVVGASTDLRNVRGFALAPPQGSCQTGQCVEGAKTTCFQGNRFSAVVDWSTRFGTSGRGDVFPVDSGNSSLFTFFRADNWEVMAKVLDGCEVNGFYWVFASGSTDVQFDLTVTDTSTGAERKYSNPGGDPAVAVRDTSAFPCQ